MDAQQAIAILDGRTRFGQKLGLETMRSLLAAAGDPHVGQKVIHVAGTNGKGSACAMMASALRAAGHRVGLYTSPHLVRFHERIQVDGAEITDEELARAMARILPSVEAHAEATYFELATLLAFQHFADANVDIIVMEVGLGGRLDATNVIDDPLVTVVTNISLEHTEVLGESESDIAAEKGGIVKPGAPLVTGATGEALARLRGIASECGAPIHVLGEEIVPMPGDDGSLDIIALREHHGLRIALAGAHQLENAALAAAALDLVDAAGLSVPADAIARGFAEARWPGRLQRVDGILLDGAHNPAGCRALAAHLNEVGLRPVLVFGALEDKDWQAMVEALAPYVREAIATRVPSPRAADTQDVARAFSQNGILAMVVEEPGHALRTAEGLAGKGGVVLVTGSLYLVGEVLGRLGPKP